VSLFYDSDPANYVASVTSEPSLDGNYAVSLWFNSAFTEESLYYTLFSVVGTTDWTDYDTVSIHPAGALSLSSFRNSVQVGAGGTIRVDDDQWHHLGFTKTGAAIRIYLDGLLEVSANQFGAALNDTYKVELGILNTFNPALGMFDCVKIWNREVTKEEVLLEGRARPPQFEVPYHWLDPVYGSDAGGADLNQGSGGTTWVYFGAVQVVLGSPPCLAYPRSAQGVPIATRPNLNQVYPFYKEGLLGADVDWAVDRMKAVAIGEGYVLDVASDPGDQFLSDVPAGARMQTSDVLVSKTTTLGVAGAASVTFRNVNRKIEAVVVYIEGDTDAASRLVCYINTATHLPVHPYGTDAVVSWPAGIFRV